jgi:hypothetical protein
MSKPKKLITYDKCQVCGHLAPSEDFDGCKGGCCPICGSKDIDDSNFDPYKDDDDEDFW